MSRKDFAVICDNLIGSSCNDCTEPCIMKFTDEEWEAYKLYQRDVNTALGEQERINDDINEYYRLKKELMEEGLIVDAVFNINIDYLRKRKKEVEKRLRELRRMEYNYTKRLLRLQRYKDGV